MKRLRLSLLVSNTVICLDRSVSCTCVRRCHTSSPKGKGQNLLISNSVSEMYFPAFWLANTNVHRLLKPGHLPTPELPKRLSLIFLYAELSQRYPIPIVKTLQYTVCICWRKMGFTLLFGFSVILNNWFQNRPPLLALNFWQRDEKLEVFWEHKWWVKLNFLLRYWSKKVSTRRGGRFWNQLCNITANPNKSVHLQYTMYLWYY